MHRQARRVGTSDRPARPRHGAAVPKYRPALAIGGTTRLEHRLVLKHVDMLHGRSRVGSSGFQVVYNALQINGLRKRKPHSPL